MLIALVFPELCWRCFLWDSGITKKVLFKTRHFFPVLFLNTFREFSDHRMIINHEYGYYHKANLCPYVIRCLYIYSTCISPRKHDALSRVRLPYSILGVVLKVYDTCLFSKNILSGRIYVALVIYSIWDLLFAFNFKNKSLN